MTVSAADSLTTQKCSVHGISSISAMFCSALVIKQPVWAVFSSYLTHEAVEKPLRNFVSAVMPGLAMGGFEGKELLGIFMSFST